MLEISIAIILLGGWSVFAIIYYQKYAHSRLDNDSKKGNFWNNEYLFEIIPSVYPTLGIFCTALGITMGIWNFDTDDIQGSIPELLDGLRLAFLATMGGIIGLFIFQKWNAILLKKIEESPNRPVKHTDELTAISELNFSINKLNEVTKSEFSNLFSSLERKFDEQIISIQKEMKEITAGLKDNTSIASASNKGIENLNTTLSESANTSEKNTLKIIDAMDANNKYIVGKFDEFSELLSKNNTEALVEVMKNVTSQFNAQMSELINKLVQENFAELNASVQNMNDWQKGNKEQIEKLTGHFQKTTEMFDISSKTLSEVSKQSQLLVNDQSKLAQLVQMLDKVLISDNKFSEITGQLTATIDTLSKTTESFDETTSKLNEWVRTERNFKDSADIIIVKLEEFRDLNSDVWKKYREEMAGAVAIIKNTSLSLGEDLTNINNEFYERLNDTLNNLDLCIQRFLPGNN